MGASGPASSAPTALVTAASAGNGSRPHVPPKVTGYRVTNNPFLASARRTPIFAIAAAHRPQHKQGTTFRYTLSESARVKLAISQRLRGRRAGKRCIAPASARRHAQACARTIVRGTLTRTSHQGANRVAFSGRIGSKALKPGHYQPTLTATSTDKLISKPQTISFTIVKH